MKILLTGGNGFLGKKILDNFDKKRFKFFLLSKNRKNIINKDLKIDFKNQYNFYDFEEIPVIVNKINPEIIIHTACCYGRNNEKKDEIYAINYTYGVELLKSVKNSRSLKKFINISTALPPNINYYSKTKYQFSKYGKNFSLNQKNKIFLNIILHNMYGPNDHFSKFTESIINFCYTNKQTINLTNGTQKRDFIYVDDVTNAIIFIINNLSLFNNECTLELGSGKMTSIREFAEIAHRLSNSCSQLKFGALRKRNFEPNELCANAELLNKMGWYPKYNIENGISEILKLKKSKRFNG